jgi:RNA polymerase sigma-70 factor (ECF subfamily)
VHEAIPIPHAPQAADLELVSLVADGDAVAASTLLGRLAKRVHRRICSILDDAADQEDATQLTLLAILRASGGFRGESTVERWADTIAVRTAMRFVHRRKRGELRINGEVDPDDIPAPEASREADESVARPVMKCLQEVAEPFRTVVYLRLVEELSIDEIANTLATSRNTVKKRLLRGRELLRRTIRRDRVIGARPGKVEP